ncbi:hypothetical protein PAE9249_03561 [Paenibacillus sp. CECT 9249]|uniref:stage II sporulation protein P n=1 Tax=Paenibacillus sp. CECT 9249 TaxID=2845385 RepID=UPI001E47A739|nr:stage II sporulation protein P [Paenibacillus sp. CECT 9249]CAH0121035.1 hypothetical protein PAE9249_03561 [Paenibacillus sp. CECT 9249]
MKATFQAIHVPRMKQKLLHGLATGRMFVILALCSMFFFILLGLGGMVQKNVNTSPVASMKGLAAAVSSYFFMDMIGMEVPHLNVSAPHSEFARQNVGMFLFRMLTGVNPLDPKTLVASEVPGLGGDEAVPLRVGKGNEALTAPEDYHQGPGLPAPGGEPDPNGEAVPEGEPNNGSDHTAEHPEDNPGNKPAETPNADKKSVFIYHSHNRESWNPVLQKDVKDPSSATKNITLVGKRMASKLEQLGVGVVHSDQDYASTVKNYNWNYSYKYSRTTVKEAMAVHKDLQYFIDIHRDSQRHDKTTVTIDGKSYAQVYFIIGHGNENWRENEKLANEIHTELEKRYPGLSRGIWGKSAKTGNGEYNQSLSSNSILIEVGGIDNSLEESYRTADVLAGLIAELYWDAEKASADADPQETE